MPSKHVRWSTLPPWESNNVFKYLYKAKNKTYLQAYVKRRQEQDEQATPEMSLATALLPREQTDLCGAVFHPKMCLLQHLSPLEEALSAVGSESLPFPYSRHSPPTELA